MVLENKPKIERILNYKIRSGNSKNSITGNSSRCDPALNHVIKCTRKNFVASETTVCNSVLKPEGSWSFCMVKLEVEDVKLNRSLFSRLGRGQNDILVDKGMQLTIKHECINDCVMLAFSRL